jgi:hypothetical protein
MHGHYEHTKDHHDLINHFEIKIGYDHWKNLGLDGDYLISLGCQKQGVFIQIFTYDQKGLCHQELSTTLKVKDVQA